jgi:serine/threonine protein kinase, bacterial
MMAIEFTWTDERTDQVPQKWQFSPPRTIRIGRSPECEITIDSPLVSRLHATIDYFPLAQGGGYWQLTNRGVNGTLINRVPVTRLVLTNGDRVEFGLTPGHLDFRSVSESRCDHAGNHPGALFCVKCGQPVRVEKRVKNYQVLKTLGQGGMGTTYLAWDLERTIVLKEMNADMAGVPKAQELFAREAKILQGLHHGGIPQYYDFFVADDRKYLAMELIHGMDLEQYILSHGPITPAMAIDWLVQLCEILAYIHQQQPPLIHRDIKPANILLRTIDRRIFLLDFGAVKEIGTQGGTRIGAPDYMAPEQNSGQPCTQSDLYAIGPTLIFLLTGRNPMDFIEIRPEGYRFQVSHLPNITPQLQAIVDRLTQRRIGDRYATAQELATALKSIR